MTEFDTLDVVGSYTGVLLREHGIGGIYEVLGFLLGDDLMTHQLPAANRVVQPGMVEQHPWLADLAMEEGFDDMDELRAYCDKLYADHGRILTLTPLVDPDWKRSNGLQDLVDMVGPDRVIAVQVPE